MKKENFITLIFGILGGMLFGLGMCMCLLPEWGMFRQGIAAGIAGLAVLLILWAARRRMAGKAPVKISLKMIGITLFGIFGTLVFGAGLCMTMLWEGLLLQGIIIGGIGILLLLFLIPLCRGWR